MVHIVVRPRCRLAYDHLTAVGCLHGQAYEGFNTIGHVRIRMTDGLCVWIASLYYHFIVGFKLHTDKIARTTSTGHCLHKERAFWKGV
jgi:hypothetical protein